MNYFNPYATLIVQFVIYDHQVELADRRDTYNYLRVTYVSHTNAGDRFNKPKCDMVYFHFFFFLTRIMHMYMYYYSFNAMYSVNPAFRIIIKEKKQTIQTIQLITYMYGNHTTQSPPTLPV